MFNQRLMKEFKENQKYVAGMVVTLMGHSDGQRTSDLFCRSFYGKNAERDVILSDGGLSYPDPGGGLGSESCDEHFKQPHVFCCLLLC